jgi:hypothetical protein
MPVKGEFAPVRGASRVVVVTTMFMRVLVEKVLIPGIDGLEPNTRVPLCEVCVWVPVLRLIMPGL